MQRMHSRWRAVLGGVGIVALAASVGCSGEFQGGAGPERGNAACSDRQDNDGDGRTDCADPDCKGAASCSSTTGGDSGTTGGGGDGGSSTTGHTWPTCASESGIAKALPSSVDIIWFIDTSGSMSTETQWVNQNLNAFASYIGGLKLDYHVIMIGRKGTGSLRVCVAPPLGGPGCSDGPRYRHIDQYVYSTDGLEKTLQTYPQWQNFLRANSTKNFVAVTDDESRMPAQDFDRQLKQLTNPGFKNGYTFHSIVAWGPDPYRGCPTGARYGHQYITLSNMTNGVKFKVCEQDWKPIFSKLAKSVASTAKPPCTYKMPKPPSGKKINPDQVQVSYTANGKTVVLPKATSKSTCGASGWYYDNPKTPTTVTLCPKTCSSMATNGKISIEFGCQGGIN